MANIMMFPEKHSERERERAEQNVEPLRHDLSVSAHRRRYTQLEPDRQDRSNRKVLGSIFFGYSCGSLSPSFHSEVAFNTVSS